MQLPNFTYAKQTQVTKIKDESLTLSNSLWQYYNSSKFFITTTIIILITFEMQGLHSWSINFNDSYMIDFLEFANGHCTIFD